MGNNDRRLKDLEGALRPVEPDYTAISSDDVLRALSPMLPGVSDDELHDLEQLLLQTADWEPPEVELLNRVIAEAERRKLRAKGG
jgi:hypothetical protein